MESDATPRKQRKANFTDEELVIMLNEIARNKMTVMSRLQNSVTHRQKKEVWRRISETVNVCGVAYRTTEELKKKWKDLKASALHNLRNHAKGGGAPQPSSLLGRRMPPEKPRLPAPPHFGDLVLSIVGDNHSGPAEPIEVDGTDSFKIEMSDGDNILVKVDHSLEIDSTVAAMAEQAEPINYEPLLPTQTATPSISLGGTALATTTATLAVPTATMGPRPVEMGAPAAILGATTATPGAPPVPLGAPRATMGAPVATLGDPGTTPGVLAAALETPTIALGTAVGTLGAAPIAVGAPVGTLGAALIAQGTSEPIHFIPAVSLATPPQSMGMESTSGVGIPMGVATPLGGVMPPTATHPASPAQPDVSDASIPTAPLHSVRHIQSVKQTARLLRKRKAMNEEEESRLFCSWLKSDTAKNETKTCLMTLKQEKVRLEIMKLKRQLMVD